MNISYNDFDDTNNSQQPNYWEQPKEPVKRKKVSFDDILSNMNLVVNNKGILQYMAPNQQEEQVYQNTHYPENIKREPLDQSVKHSYIYNKYFKDYNDTNGQAPIVRVPKTIEEYKRMLLEDRVKAIQHKRMIEQVKSKKMMFTSTPDARINPRNIQASSNGLRKMSFN